MKNYLLVPISEMMDVMVLKQNLCLNSNIDFMLTVLLCRDICIG